MQCDSCELWFHLLCIGLGEDEVSENEDYMCFTCKQKNTGSESAPIILANTSFKPGTHGKKALKLSVEVKTEPEEFVDNGDEALEEHAPCLEKVLETTAIKEEVMEEKEEDKEGEEKEDVKEDAKEEEEVVRDTAVVEKSMNDIELPAVEAVSEAIADDHDDEEEEEEEDEEEEEEEEEEMEEEEEGEEEDLMETEESMDNTSQDVPDITTTTTLVTIPQGKSLVTDVKLTQNIDTIDLDDEDDDDVEEIEDVVEEKPTSLSPGLESSTVSL